MEPRTLGSLAIVFSNAFICGALYRLWSAAGTGDFAVCVLLTLCLLLWGTVVPLTRLLGLAYLPAIEGILDFLTRPTLTVAVGYGSLRSLLHNGDLLPAIYLSLAVLCGVLYIELPCVGGAFDVENGAPNLLAKGVPILTLIMLMPAMFHQLYRAAVHNELSLFLVVPIGFGFIFLSSKALLPEIAARISDFRESLSDMF